MASGSTFRRVAARALVPEHRQAVGVTREDPEPERAAVHGVRSTQLRIDLRRVVVEPGIERVEQQLALRCGAAMGFADRFCECRRTEQTTRDPVGVSAGAGVRHRFLLAAHSPAWLPS